MKNKDKFYGILILVALLLWGILPAYAGDNARIGTAGGVQVLIPVSAHELAMAGANIAFTEGVDALYWNPAGLSEMSGSAAGTFSTMTIFNDIKVNYLGLGVNMGRLGHLGFDIKAFDFGDIPITTQDDPDGLTGQTYSPTFSTIGLTYANKLTSTIKVGMTGKMIYESIPRATATAFAFDLGVQYSNIASINGLSFAVVAKNIGTNLKYEGSAFQRQVQDPETKRIDFLNRSAASDQLPASLDIGLAYKYQVMETSNITVSSVFQNNNLENDAMRFGAEYNYNDFIAIRGGYLYMTNTDAKDQLYTFALGAGLQYKLGGTMVGIDYAFRDSQYFNANNMFSLKIGF